MKSKARLKQEKQFGLIQFVWFGFALTTGVRFFSTFAVWSNNGPGTSHNRPIGMHALWVLILTGLMAWGCAYAYCKLSRIHHSNFNGAGYIYTRSTWGRLAGGFVGLMQYFLVPIVIMIQTVFLFRGLFSIDYAAGNHLGFQQWTTHLGPFENLWLDLAGISIYMGAALVALLGIRYFRWFVNFNSIAAWVISGGLLVSYLVLAVQAHGQGFDYWQKSVDHGGGNQISFAGCLNVGVSAFFTYSGFETYTTAGRNLKDPEKNTGRGVGIIFIIVIAFLSVVGLICFAGFYGDKGQKTAFNQLMHFTVWNRFSNAGVRLLGVIIMLTHNFLYKFQLSNENMFYGSTLMQPLAEEGYVPEKYSVLDEYKGDVGIKAMKLNYFISFLVLLAFLVIPDLIDGASLSGGASKGAVKAGDVWNLSSLSEVSAVIQIMVYFVVIMCVFKLAKEHKLTLKWWEMVMFGVASGYLLILFGFHYYDLLTGLFHPQGSSNHDKLLIKIAAGTELIFDLILYGVAVLVVWRYYRPKLLFRLQHQPNKQKQLDSEFRLRDDWDYVCARFRRVLNDYLRRNRAIYSRHPNASYQQASDIKRQLRKVVREYNDSPHL